MVLLVLYLLTLSVDYKYKELPSGFYGVLYRIKPADYMMIFFILTCILRYDLKWKCPYIFWAVLVNIGAFSFATFIAHYYGYAISNSYTSYTSWAVPFCTEIFYLIGFLALYNFIASVSWNTWKLILHFIVTSMSVYGLIGIYDMAADTYGCPKLSVCSAYLLSNNIDMVEMSEKHLFMGTFANQGRASGFYFCIAFLSLINMTLLPKNKKLLYGIFLWVPFTVIFLTLARAAWIAVIISSFLVMVLSFFEHKYFISRLFQYLWIAFMTAIIFVLFVSISPEFLQLATSKFVGTKKESITADNDYLTFQTNKDNTLLQMNKENTPLNKEDTPSKPLLIQQQKQSVRHGGILYELQNGFVGRELAVAFKTFCKHPLGYGYFGYPVQNIGNKAIYYHNFFLRSMVEGGVLGIIIYISLIVILLLEPILIHGVSLKNLGITSIYIPFVIGVILLSVHGMFLTRSVYLVMALILALNSIDCQPKPQNNGDA
jgi:hypothetical protein